jgi:RNA polymerase sigma-70 factor (ECF subfamily)
LDYSTLDDIVLIHLIVLARTEALSALYDRYGRLVYSLALNIVGDQATAEEITQDVFLRIWEKAGTYRVDQSKVSTWLTSITRHRAIDMLRRRGIRPEQNSVAWEEANLNVTPWVEESPEAITEVALEQRRIRAAISGLPANQQQALALAFFQGLTHSEIAARLNEPLGTVKTRIRLAMQKLREILGEDLRVRKDS